MFHSGKAWFNSFPRRKYTSDPIPAELVGRWKIVNSPFIYEFTDEGTHSNFFSISHGDYAISSDGTTLTWCEFDYRRKFDTSTSLPGIWERYWPDDNVYEEFNFHIDGTYATHWRPSDEYYYGSYFENVPTQGKLRFREFNSIVTIAGSQLSFNPLYEPIRTATFTLDGDNLFIVFQDGTATYERVT